MELTPGLACRRLDFRWPGTQTGAPLLLRSVDAVFPPGTVSLITGKTGAGKSTLLHLLAGLLRPTSGEVWADGKPVSRWTVRHRDLWRRQVGVVFQHLALIPDLTAAENLLLPLIPRKMTGPHMHKAIGRQLADADLSDLTDTPAGSLSGGQRQRLAIARALVGHPRYILADEPTAFQDDDHARRIHAHLCSAAHDGAVVIIGSHDPRLRSSCEIDRRFHLAAATLTMTQGAPS